jgi:hypothetical protein
MKRRWKKKRLVIGIVVAVVLMGTGFAFDIPGTHPSIFSLVHDLRHAPVIVDHGVSFHAYRLAFMNFIAPGSINTVADALEAIGIPLTVRQARIVPLCKTLDQLSGPIIVQPDPYQYGVASWYGPGFQGQVAASGEMYNMYDLTAAHRTLPLQSQVRVVSQHTGNSVVVRINDRGPYADGRIIDLSYQAKSVLGMDDLSAVYLERLDPTALDSCK